MTTTLTATVTKTADPERRGRIMVTCVGLLGDDDSEVPQWIEPMFPWGWFTPPDVGEQVVIQVPDAAAGDDVSLQSRLSASTYHWPGMRVWTGPGAVEARPVPADAQINYGKRRGFFTPVGHSLLFDDTPTAEQVRLGWKNKIGSEAFFAIDSAGSILQQSADGSIFYINATSGEISLWHASGTLISLTADGVNILGSANTHAVIGKDGVSITSGSGITLTANSVHSSSPAVIIGNAQSLSLNEFFFRFFLVMNSWAPIPNDGGAALKTAWTAAFAGVMPPGAP